MTEREDQSPETRPGDKWLEKNERELLELIWRVGRHQSDLVVIVEGRRDESALRELGISGKMIRVHRGLSRLALIDEVVESVGPQGEVLILTDFDDEGQELCAFLEDELEHRRVHVNRALRRDFRRLMAHLCCIEQLVSIAKKRDSHVPVR
ncbi:MAG: toprim domain-containing protein [Candidatus Thorarchaeota archaeon]|nr:toprim domain-containing protein [Candidatus Thorarchaeota archaeon]